MTESQERQPEKNPQDDGVDCEEAVRAPAVNMTPLRRGWRIVWRVLVAIVGSLVILAGIGLSIPMVPGPGFAVILAGLAILATEFSGPRRLLRWLPRRIRQWKADRARRRAR